MKKFVERLISVCRHPGCGVAIALTDYGWGHMAPPRPGPHPAKP